MSKKKKLEALHLLRTIYEQKHLPEDSVYALLLHRIGNYEYANKNYSEAIKYTLESLRINMSGRQDCSKQFALNSYYNMGYYYDKLLFFEESFEYYDSTILVAKSLPGNEDAIVDARLEKAYLFFRTGDYQKSIEESNMGISFALEKKDTLQYVSFLNQRAQALFYQSKVDEALHDLSAAIYLAKSHGNLYRFQLSSSYKTSAYIFSQKGDFNLAEKFFFKCVSNRPSISSLFDPGQIADDYNDIGDFYRDSLMLFSKAEKYYRIAIPLCQQYHDSVRLARVYLNYGVAYYHQTDLINAEAYYDKALSLIRIPKANNPSQTITAAQLSFFGNKDLVLALFKYKTELLFSLYKKGKNEQYLNKAMKTAIFTDSLFTQMRHNLFGDASKLYWRRRYNEFYETVIDVCFNTGKTELAFFFMEKSRAVLLNDKINELNAGRYLSKKDAASKLDFQLSLLTLQETLLSLNRGTKSYKDAEAKFLQVKENYEHFIRSIDKKNPDYYQYKYNDKVPSLNDIQAYLSKYQNFIHYFISDTVVYILDITSTGTKMIRKRVANYADSLHNFLLLCSNKSSLNSDYASYAKKANNIYKVLFEELNIREERVIICPDNFLIPFEALCTDESGEKFLAHDYAFSYVYSANVMLKKLINGNGKGNFLGFAPVHFNNTDLTTLTGSDKYLKSSAGFYSRIKLLTDKNATKSNFIGLAPFYEIVNVFSHATADSNNAEPMLFMSDSSLRLSELQRILNPATRLVVLSACETSAGKMATGEGIYSLARGFAGAGIPSVAATLWKADDQAIYGITQQFHENVASGMPLDEALQKAKQAYMEKNTKERSLPYYWANMIIVGNADPIVLSKDSRVWWWVGGGVALLIITGFALIKRRQKKVA